MNADKKQIKQSRNARREQRAVLLDILFSGDGPAVRKNLRSSASICG